MTIVGERDIPLAQCTRILPQFRCDASAVLMISSAASLTFLRDADEVSFRRETVVFYVVNSESWGGPYAEHMRD